MKTREIFGNNLKKIRKDLGLTQEKFAELIDIQWRSLVDIENGKYLPRPENIDKICEKLNIPISALFDLTNDDINDERAERIKLINLKLAVLSDDRLNIIYNIVNNAFN